MWTKIKREWDMMWKAGSIMLARVKLLLGAVWTAITQSGVDLSTVITNPTWLLVIKVTAAIFLVDGALSETIRRHNASDLQ